MHVQGVMANRQGSGQKVLVAGGDKNLLLVQKFFAFTCALGRAVAPLQKREGP